MAQGNSRGNQELGVHDERRRRNDIHRRIRNITDAYPASGWDADESAPILAALESLVRGRQTIASVVDITTGEAVG